MTTLVTAAALPRRKATVACESCRKKRAKCSGVRPCTSCDKYGLECYFDYQRQRRGPRPKSQSTSNRPVPLTPMQPASNLGSTQIDPESTAIASSEFSENSLIPEIPPLETWREKLKQVIEADQVQLSDPNAASLDRICHLVELFWTHTNVQQLPMLSASIFFQSLERNSCPVSLCYAICAASIKYSCNEAVKSSPDLSFDETCAERARKGLHIMEDDRYLDRIQTLSVLVAYELYRGNGAQAWCDTAFAMALIQTSKLKKPPNPEMDAILDIADRYLRISVLNQCVGNLALKISLQPQPIEEVLDSKLIRKSESQQLEELLDLLIRIQEFCKIPFTSHDPPPWQLKSDFRKLQSEIDEHIMRHSEEFSFSTELLRSLAEDGSMELILCAFVWHCCVMALNRVFLPIKKGQPPAGNSTRDIRILVPFPGGPETFLIERANVCVASATTASILCRELVDNGSFILPPIMGYSLFHSSIILLDQLDQASPQDIEDIRQHLQVNFTILGAMKRFYMPSQEWIQVLLRLQNAVQVTVTAISAEETDTKPKFANYFARFENITEPALTAFQTPKPKTKARQNGKNSSARGTEKNAQPAQTKSPVASQPLAQVDRSWADEYHRQLQEHMMAIEDSDTDTEQAIERPPPPGRTSREGSTASAGRKKQRRSTVESLNTPVFLLPAQNSPMGRGEDLQPLQAEVMSVPPDQYAPQSDTDYAVFDFPTIRSSGSIPPMSNDESQRWRFNFDGQTWSDRSLSLPSISHTDTFDGFPELTSLLNDHLASGEQWSAAYIGERESSSGLFWTN